MCILKENQTPRPLSKRLKIIITGLFSFWGTLNRQRTGVYHLTISAYMKLDYACTSSLCAYPREGVI